MNPFELLDRVTLAAAIARALERRLSTVRTESAEFPLHEKIKAQASGKL